jgi:hypothetical protein
MGIQSSNPQVGQQTSADSVSVVLSSDQTSVPITGSITVSGTSNVTVQNSPGSSAVNIQDGGNSITVDGSVSVSNFPATQPISASSLPLPTGASTSALQTTGNSSLSSIDTKVPANLTVKAASTPAIATDPALVVTISPNNSITASISNSSIEISNDVGNPVPISGTVTADIGTTNGLALDSSVNSLLKPASTLAAVTTVGTITNTVVVKADSAVNQTNALKVDGSATTQPVSGTITANAGSGTFAVSAASLPLPSGASTSTLQTTGNNSLSSIDTKIPALGQAVAASSVPVVLTAAQISTLTPPTTVTVTQGTGTNLHTVIDSGTVTANLGTIAGISTETTLSALNTKVPSGLTVTSTRLLTDSSGVTQPISASSLPLPTGASTLTEQQSQTTILNTIATNTGAQSVDTLTTGTITALNGTIAINAQGAYTISALITGTWVATLVAEGLMANGTTWQQLPMYVVQTTLPYPATFTATTNASILITGGGYTQVRIRSSAFTSGTVSVALNASLAQQTIFSSQLGNWAVTSTNATNPTYSTGIIGLNVAGAATDIFTITGSATKTIKIKHLSIDGTQTTASNLNVQLVKRSTANTGGTSTTLTVASYDSTNAAATAVVRSYTANPTVGTLVGIIHAEKLFTPTTTTVGDELSFPSKASENAQDITLRGTSEVLAINLNGATVGGSSFNIDITWTEE